MTKAKWRTAERHGETWHGSGPTRETARRLYLDHPFIPVTDLASVLKVSRQRFNACIEGLQTEREKRCAAILARLREDVTL
jgi:hypothetical protein